MTRKRKRSPKSKSPRNAPCPCGSGRKYKHCCEKPPKSNIETAYLDSFVDVPKSIPTYLLDTCVWGEILRNPSKEDAFVSRIVSNDNLAGLSIYTLFELSRAKKLIKKLDALFLRARHNIWIALLYDQLQEREFRRYPSPPNIQWMPMSSITDESQPDVMSKFTGNTIFKRKREEHLEFGYSDFMSLEKFKKNYPPDSSGKYSPEQALDFAEQNAIDFLLRRFPSVLKSINNTGLKFNPAHLPSIQIRSLFIFYKYYIYHQSPMKSDFLDFANISYAPYADFFVTEKNAMNALKHIKSNGVGLNNTEILHVTDFVEDL